MSKKKTVIALVPRRRWGDGRKKPQAPMCGWGSDSAKKERKAVITNFRKNGLTKSFEGKDRIHRKVTEVES